MVAMVVMEWMADDEVTTMATTFNSLSLSLPLLFCCVCVCSFSYCIVQLVRRDAAFRVVGTAQCVDTASVATSSTSGALRSGAAAYHLSCCVIGFHVDHRGIACVFGRVVGLVCVGSASLALRGIGGIGHQCCRSAVDPNRRHRFLDPCCSTMGVCSSIAYNQHLGSAILGDGSTT
jgi:hypothetical protein